MKLSAQRRVFSWLMNKLRHGLYLTVIYARDLRSEFPNTPPEGYEARFVGIDELLDLCGRPELRLSSRFVREAMTRGDVCTAMFYKGEMIAYMWRSTSVAPHTHDVQVVTQKPYRYGYKALTLEAYRGRHIPVYLAPVSSPFYVERGYTHHVGFVEMHNYASRRSEERRGSYKVGIAGYISLFNKNLTFRTPSVRKIGFGFIAKGATVSVRAASVDF